VSRGFVAYQADSLASFIGFRGDRTPLFTFSAQHERMSLISDVVRSTFTTKCSVCGAVIRKRDALDHEGLAFCSVLHEAEYIVATLD